MSTPRKKKSTIRGFERDLRIQELVGSQVIKSASEVPADAIPATLEVIARWRSSYSTFSRAPFYQDIHFTCDGVAAGPASCGCGGCANPAQFVCSPGAEARKRGGLPAGLHFAKIPPRGAGEEPAP